MLPSELIQNIASFLPAKNAPIVEIIWNPKLKKEFYEALHKRDGIRRKVYGSRSGIEYTLITRYVSHQYVTSIIRDGESIGCECYHGTSWNSAEEASNWLVRVMYSGHDVPRIRLHR